MNLDFLICLLIPGYGTSSPSIYSVLRSSDSKFESLDASAAPENATIAKSGRLSNSVVSHVKSTGPSSVRFGLLAKSSQNLLENRNKYLTFDPIPGGCLNIRASLGSLNLIERHTDGGTARITSSTGSRSASFFILIFTTTLALRLEIDITVAPRT